MEHIAIPAGERHPPHNWRFANEAARLAASVSAADVDCYALQIDTGELWMLESVGPASWKKVGGSSPSFADYVAGAAISGHQIVIADASGSAVYASADDASHIRRVVGITTGAASSGAPVRVQTRDVIEHSGWSWIPDQPVFLGINGALVSTVPPSAAFVQIVGTALSATRLLVGVQPPIALS